MKTMTCTEMGGPCDAKMTAPTKEAMMDEGMKHVRAAHPEMVDGIEKMSPEASAEWQKKFDTAWTAAPEAK